MMIRSRAVSAAEAVLLLLCCAGVCRAGVEVRLTKGDRSVKLERQPDVAFVPGPGQSLEPRIAVHEEQPKQVMDGFGAALTDSSAWLINGLHERRRSELLMRLFSRDGVGIGLSCLRVPIGSSDFSLSTYTYEDEPGRFTIEHDKAYILPILRTILRANPELTVLASPWTAPAHLKDNGSLFGGSLGDEPKVTERYSEYLVSFIKAYEQEGVPIHAITLQNEPCNGDPNLPSMKLDWWDLVNIETVAFRNPDGSVALIVLNPTPESQRFSVWWRDQLFAHTLDSRSVATFHWN
jgi:glucosylceramidase